eukprot:4981589-Pyramimonas_sp.AAC.1
MSAYCRSPNSESRLQNQTPSPGGAHLGSEAHEAHCTRPALSFQAELASTALEQGADAKAFSLRVDGMLRRREVAAAKMAHVSVAECAHSLAARLTSQAASDAEAVARVATVEAAAQRFWISVLRDPEDRNRSIVERPVELATLSKPRRDVTTTTRPNRRRRRQRRRSTAARR